MGVIYEDHDRPRLGKLDRQHEEAVQQRVVAGHRRLTSARRHAEQLRQRRRQPADELPPLRARDRRHRGAEQLERHAARKVALKLVSTRRQDEEPEVTSPSAGLVQQPGLAHACRTLEHHHAAITPPRRGKGVADRCKLLLTLQHVHHAHGERIHSPGRCVSAHDRGPDQQSGCWTHACYPAHAGVRAVRAKALD